MDCYKNWSSLFPSLVVLTTTQLVSAATVPLLVADGRFTPDEDYTVCYWIEYQQDDQGRDGSDSGWVGATGIGRGFLALGTNDAGDHFMYYALPKGYVDNTFTRTPNSSVPPIVGNYNGGQGHELGSGLIGSDNLGISGGTNAMELYPTLPLFANNEFRMTVDYLADFIEGGVRTDIKSWGVGEATANIPAPDQWDRRDGGLLGNSADDALKLPYIKNIATSMEWNIDHFGPTGLNYITANHIATLAQNVNTPLSQSPDVIRLNDPGNPEDGKAILAADGYSYQAANPLWEDWIYEVAYEFQFDAALFGSEWADPLTDPTTLFRLGTPHASPYKGPNGALNPGPPTFILITKDPPIGGPFIVPEPATASLGLLAIGGLMLRRRRMA